MRTRASPNARSCPVCVRRSHEPAAGRIYLPPGSLSRRRVHLDRMPRQVFRLRIVCANAYPELIRRCESAMAEVLPNKVSRTPKIGCTEVAAYSKHWPCLFPQHGPGRKHERKIELTPWQQELVDLDPRPLIRGLLHSDGCRVLNWVNGTPYPALPLQQRVGGHPGDLRAGLRPAGDRVAAEQPVQPVGGQAGECRPAGRVRGAQTVRPGRGEVIAPPGLRVGGSGSDPVGQAAACGLKDRRLAETPARAWCGSCRPRRSRCGSGRGSWWRGRPRRPSRTGPWC